jgi:phage terminase small subunit
MSVIEQLPEHLKQPPPHLSSAATEFFLHVVATGSYDAPARSLLITYCEICDRLEEVRRELSEKGRYFTDKHGQPRVHPLVKEQESLINEKGKLFRLLGWDQAPPDAGQGAFFFMPAGKGRNASH